MSGQQAVVGLLLEKGANVHGKDKDEWTALHWAAMSGQQAVVGLLLEKGANVNGKDKDEWTALHWAAMSGQQAVVGLLLERSEEHTSELQSHSDLVCRLLLEKKKI